MPRRRRFVVAMAVGSAAALVGALSTGFTIAGVASTSEPGDGVTFTSQSAVAPLVAHYTVSPEDREGSSTSARIDTRQLPRLSKRFQAPKGHSSATGGSAAPLSDNTIADSVASSSSKLATPANQSGGNEKKASFIGQQSSATTCSYFGPGCNPPDMGLAASSQFVLQGVNTQFEVLNTSGKVQAGWPVSAQSFFGAPNVTNPDGTPCDTAHQSQPFLSDPRELYDPIDHRFWAAMLQVEGSPAFGVALDCPFKSVYYIAVSQTGDPRGSWNVYEFNMSLDGQFGADFTQIGLNGSAVYFSANMFGPGTGLNNGFYAELFEANKSKMEHGKGNFTADGFFDLQAQGPGTIIAGTPFIADTVQPALNLDGSGGSGEVFADTLDGPDPVTGNFCGFFGGGAADSCSGLALWRMTNPIGHDSGGSAPVLKGSYVPTKKFLASSFENRFSVVPADQPSCNQCVDASDLRISATPMVRDGVLYAAWESGLNNGTQVVPGIVWAQVDLGDFEGDVSAQSGYYNLSGDAAVTYPALMPDAEGNVVMIFEHMSHTVFPETRFIVKEGDGQFHGRGTLLKAGEDSYRPQLCGTGPANTPPTPPFVCRWGDFSATSFDGSGTIWFAGEYANKLNLGPPQNGRNWGTWIGAVEAS